MTDKPEICGVLDGDCPYIKQLKEALQELAPGECGEECDKTVICQSLEEFIKQFGLVPVFETDIRTLPLPPPKVTLIPVKDVDVGKDIPLKKSKSRELRAGRLYVGCECEKRYGLQDTCPRSECQGSPECLNKPPNCGPSEFCNAKHLLKKMKPNWRAIMYPGEPKFSARY